MLVRQFHTVVATSLRRPGNSLDLLHLLIVGWRDTIQESSDLGTKVGGGDEGAQDVLWQDVGVRQRIVLDIVIGNIDVLQTEREVRGRDSADTPVGFAAENLLLVVRSWGNRSEYRQC